MPKVITVTSEFRGCDNDKTDNVNNENSEHQNSDLDVGKYRR